MWLLFCFLVLVIKIFFDKLLIILLCLGNLYLVIGVCGGYLDIIKFFFFILFFNVNVFLG